MSTDEPEIESDAEPEREFDYDDAGFAPGHRACSGCGPALVARHVADEAGENTIIAHPTGCMEVVSSPFPESSWGVSWIHNVFANAPGVASGIEAAYRSFTRQGREEFEDHEDVNFVVLAGDGATFDIGIRSLSGMFERGHDILYVAYDNEAYMNTGVQRSGSTPTGAHTTTTPSGTESVGEVQGKKDMPAIAAAHGVEYVATASISDPIDFRNKVREGLEVDGPAYVQVLAPCPVGWGFEADETVDLGELAVETGVYPIYEMEDGEVTGVNTIRDRTDVEEYLKRQDRFSHLFESEEGEETIEAIQEEVDARIEELGMDG
ncbi:MAG: thiamine pyrophosphate-dependent enzyme [Haloferacaceae archaeon]